VKICGLNVDSLLAPLKPSRQEPSDGQHAPPQTSRHQEEVEEHAEHRAPPILVVPLLEDPLRRQVDRVRVERLVADDVVAGAEADEEDDGHDEVGQDEEDDGLLRVREPRRVDEEGSLQKGAGAR